MGSRFGFSQKSSFMKGDLSFYLMPNLSSTLTVVPAPPSKTRVHVGFWANEEAGVEKLGKAIAP